jgi:hypothetical protein
MNPYFVIYGLVTVGIFICFIENRDVRRITQVIYFVAVLITLSGFAGMRSPGVDADFENYAGWYGLIQSGAAPLVAWIRDPAFGAISYAVARSGLSYSVVAFVYALAGITATWILAFSISMERWATLLFYLMFCQYYMVLDMTEIRAAVAIPLMACSLYLACEGRRRQAVAVFLLALVFHFSAIAVLPFLILIFMGVRFRSRVWLLALAIAGAVAAVSMRSLIDLLSGLYRISEYLNGGAEEHDLRVISWYALAHLLAIVVALFFWKKLTLHQRMAVVACGAGLMLFLIFGWNTGLATRLLYIFDVYWLLIMLMLVEHLKGEAQVLYVGALCIVGFALYWKSLQYMEPYSVLNKWDAYLNSATHAPLLIRLLS